VIVADDCSTDRTQAIVKEYADRYPDVVKLLLRSVNIGSTRNFLGVHNSATTPYVAHIDGDDLMLPGKLQKQVEFLDANPDFSVVWHRVNLFDDDGGFVPGEDYDLSFFPDGVVTLEHALRLGAVSAHSSIMYRGSARTTRQTGFETLDLFYTWEYLASGKGKVLDEVLGSYRVSAQNSIQIKGIVKIQRFVVHHARYYLKLRPEQRRNLFILAVINFMVDVKNFRGTAWSFAGLALESASLVSPLVILRTVAEMRRIPPCSPLGSLHIARARKDRGTWAASKTGI
jgi:glycosyltransferase involved in cell wall biosynthesis